MGAGWTWREDGTLDIGGVQYRMIADAKGRAALLAPALGRARLVHVSLLTAVHTAETFGAPSYIGAEERLGQLWDAIGVSADALRGAARSSAVLLDPQPDFAAFGGQASAALVDLADEIFDRAK